MPKSNNQKMKQLYLLKLLWEKSDEEHPIAMSDILHYLENNDIAAERKSIYNDIQSLIDFGFDINLRKGPGGGYYIGDRGFELAELKILTDSVQASRFLSDKKTRSLMGKLSTLCSEDQARQLRRQNLLSNSAHAAEEGIFYIVDAIHRAINDDRIIAFYYFDLDEHKQKQYRYGGHHMKTSPVALVWDDENYYLVAWDSKYQTVRNYRVDRMEDVIVTEEERHDKDKIGAIDLKDYTSVNFSMFSGKRTTVSLVFEKELVGVMIDRFGKDLTIYPSGDGRLVIHPEIAVSTQFFGWLFGLEGKATVTGPAEVVEALKAQMEAFLAAQWEKNAFFLDK